MAVLANAKHERFAQELAKGTNQGEAYALAGYKPSDSSAANLRRNPKIAARIAELLSRAATKVELTVATATERLLRYADKGEAIGDAAGLQAARASVMDACKLSGLVVDHTQVTQESVVKMISDRPLTDEEFAERHGVDLGAATGPAALPN